MIFRQAAKADAEGLARFRMDFMASVDPSAIPEGFYERTLEYFNAHLGEADTICFIAEENGEIASGMVTCMFDIMPLRSCPSGRNAELLNVFTREGYRRRGLAEKLIHMTIEEAKKRGADKMLLKYTDLGHPLYLKVGFKELDRQMEMRL